MQNVSIQTSLLCCAKVGKLSDLNPWSEEIICHRTQILIKSVSNFFFSILKISHQKLFHVPLNLYYLRLLPGLNFREYGRMRITCRKSNTLFLGPALWSKKSWILVSLCSHLSKIIKFVGIRLITSNFSTCLMSKALIILCCWVRQRGSALPLTDCSLLKSGN